MRASEHSMSVSLACLPTQLSSTCDWEVANSSACSTACADAEMVCTQSAVRAWQNVSVDASSEAVAWVRATEMLWSAFRVGPRIALQGHPGKSFALLRTSKEGSATHSLNRTFAWSATFLSPSA